jgi:hypothetical protein
MSGKEGKYPQPASARYRPKLFMGRDEMGSQDERDGEEQPVSEPHG